MRLETFVAQLAERIGRTGTGDAPSAVPAIIECLVQERFSPDDPVRVIQCRSNDDLYSVLVVQTGALAVVTVTQSVLPTPRSTDGLASAYEVALTDAINRTPCERVVGRDVAVTLDDHGVDAASCHVASILAR